MSGIRITFVCDSSDLPAVDQLKGDMQSAAAGMVRQAADQPAFDIVEGFENIPPVIGDFSVLIIILPAKGSVFSSEARNRILAIHRSQETGVQPLLPISIEPTRNRPPSPIHELVAFKFHSTTLPRDALVRRLTTLALNLSCLRVASADRSVFVSYRQIDGQVWAETIEEGLSSRGYTVWRDEKEDSDDLQHLQPGTEAQASIERAIVQHGFVLVVDTLQAPYSDWVNEEVELAIRHMLPILPVVIEDGSAGTPVEQQPWPGGRFRALRESRHEVRIKLTERHAAGEDPNHPVSCPDKTVVQSVLKDSFYDLLEAAMWDRLLAHLRTRRALLAETYRQFTKINFKLHPLGGNQLLYEAVSDRCSKLTPNLHLRLLVQCAPYDVLLQRTIGNLDTHFRCQQRPFQYGLLVHQTAAYSADKAELLADAEHMMVLKPDEIAELPTIFRLT